MASPKEARAPFPQNVSDFENDERIAFTSSMGVWHLLDENGEQWEFNERAQRWHQPVSEGPDIDRLRNGFADFTM